jgi:hypothetical protein
MSVVLLLCSLSLSLSLFREHCLALAPLTSVSFSTSLSSLFLIPFPLVLTQLSLIQEFKTDTHLLSLFSPSLVGSKPGDLVESDNEQGDMPVPPPRSGVLLSHCRLCLRCI